MGRLFWKIFLWFWMTLILIVVAVSWGTAIYLHTSDNFQIRDLRSRFLMQRVQSVRQALRFSDESSAQAILEEQDSHSSRFQIYVFDDLDHEILNRSLNPDTPGIMQHRSVVSEDGDFYQIISVQNKFKRPGISSIAMRPFKRNPGILLVWLGIALSLSGLVCFWLALYLSRPIRYLQRASQQLSHGHLDTRVAHIIGNRRDEIADLGKDFDKMAERLQNLINNQKQLLSDISHELRSPLARLQVALGLAQKKTGAEASIELQRIEHETNRLNDLVGQALTLSRLDAGASYPTDDYIDIAALLADIIKDCDYEARDQHKHVTLACTQSWTINVNGELLRRALENIIRNAIYYTADNTTVKVSIETINQTSQQAAQRFRIRVCDEGPGISDNKLEHLFEPFVRLTEARDRDSGGYGLGLAIAKRSIEFHQGQIRAYNQQSVGLCIEVLLPIT